MVWIVSNETIPEAKIEGSDCHVQIVVGDIDNRVVLLLFEYRRDDTTLLMLLSLPLIVRYLIGWSHGGPSPVPIPIIARCVIGATTTDDGSEESFVHASSRLAGSWLLP